MELALAAQDQINRILFFIRRSFTSRLRLRRRPPAVESRFSPSAVKNFASDETAFYRLLLKSALDKDLFQEISHCIDVGCKNWSSLPALVESFSCARFTGIEVDPYRRYGNLYLRGDYARAQVSRATNLGRRAEFVEGDFCQIDFTPKDRGEVVLFCLFYPFVSANPCLKWGLPLQYSNYEKILEKIESTPANKKFLLSVHQGEWEAEVAEALYLKKQVATQKTVIPASKLAGLWPSPHDQVLFFGSVN